jgi:hypothetical protein
MTLLELVSYLRTNILDDTGGQGVDWSSHSEEDYDSYQLRWSNEELVSNINEAINQVYRRSMPIEDIYSIELVESKSSYKLPSYIIKILLARIDSGRSIKEVSLNDLWKIDSFDKIIGEPNVYVTDSLSNTLRVFPTPDKDQMLSLMVYRLPKNTLVWHSDQDVSLELRGEFNIPMLYYAAHLCYLKDEANTLDPTRASTFMQLFDREFPFTSSYSTIRKGRTANRPIKYGGL